MGSKYKDPRHQAAAKLGRTGSERSATGYASGVKPWTQRGRRVVAFLAISGVLFAPATYEAPSDWAQLEPTPMGARVLAPTVREGMVAAKLSTSGLQAGDRLQPKPLTFAVPTASAAVLLIGALSALGLALGRSSPSLTFLRNFVPR
jgi:hypothetical protein